MSIWGEDKHLRNNHKMSITSIDEMISNFNHLNKAMQTDLDSLRTLQVT